MPQPSVPFPQSPVVPNMVDGAHVIQFQCHKGIGCWNACCSNIDISLTPYDILRLQKRLGLSSAEFLTKYTFPYELDKDDIAGVKFRPVEGGSACQFMTPEGCGVYEDRPTACRYYPVALVSMRKEGEAFDSASYALVKEDHCKGHEVARSLTIDDYRKEQGVVEYDELARGWRQLILKKKSTGPAIGKPSLKSRQLFFMACYNLDQFRAFVTSDSFCQLFALPPEEHAKIAGDDVELMLFGFRFLRQVLFGEESIPLNDDAAKARAEKVREKRMQEEREAAARLAAAADNDHPLDDED
jgi:Fe-S-cluster containining protein